MRKKNITAAELIDQLKNDPDYKERAKKRDAELKPIWDKRKKDEEELVSEIRKIGYKIDSIYDLVNNKPHEFLERKFIGKYNKAYPILIQHLNKPHEQMIREGIIRALTEKDGGEEVEKALFEQFEKETNNEIKWIIANALSVVVPKNRHIEYTEVFKFYANRNI